MARPHMNTMNIICYLLKKITFLHGVPERMDFWNKLQTLQIIISEKYL
jgi:hypothetical protein